MAADKKKKTPIAIKMPTGIELSVDQKTQLDALNKEFGPKLPTNISKGITIKKTLTITAEQKTARAEAIKVPLRYSDDGSSMIFGNGVVELTIVKATGYIQKITNKVSGRDYKIENDGSWPFGMELGFPNVPKFLTVEVVGNTPHPQSVVHKTASLQGGKVLRLTYDNMLSSGGAFTGVKMDVDISLKDDADYFLIKAKIENNGDYYINNLYSGTGALVAANSRQEETLIVPGWDYGKVYPNPHGFFKDRETYGYPIFASSCALATGWLDLCGPDGGIGIGYLNRQGLTMLFNVQQAKEGLNVNWQLFNLVHDEPWGHVGGVFGLAPGKSFSTDQWIVAPHSGDWHRMADIYREEYEKAFKGTFFNEKNNNPIAEKVDFVGAIAIHNERSGLPAKNFEEVIAFVEGMSESLQAKPENMLITLLGQDQHWPHRMPDFYPANTEAGSNEGLKKMIKELSNMGMKGLLLYGHPFYNHPKANDYVAEADTGYDHLNRMWPEIGNAACLDSPEWLNLWKRKYIPGFAELGAAGVYWDQGPTQYLVCPLPGHSHGADKIKQLASHTKGILQLQEDFRGLYARKKKNSTIFWIECSSDLTGRTMDIWTTTPGYYAKEGGELKREIVRYAVPYHLCANIGPNSADDANYTFVNGFIGWANTGGSEEVMAAQRQFAKLRRELRNADAPGFPYGFKDNVGLQTSDPNLVARSYRSDDGISVLYFAKEPLEGNVTVNTSELGFAGKDIKNFTVKLEKNQAGYKIILP